MFGERGKKREKGDDITFIRVADKEYDDSRGRQIDAKLTDQSMIFRSYFCKINTKISRIFFLLLPAFTF